MSLLKKNSILEFKIDDLAFGGKGIAKKDNFLVFIDGALPGQTVRAKIIKKKENYAEAKLLEIIHRSDQEIETIYQEVPGSPWVCLPIELQIKYKKQQVFDLFHKFAQINLTSKLDEIISSPQTNGYRNKMEYSFGYDVEDNFALGSKKRGQFYLVENLEKASGLFDPEIESFLPKLRQSLQKTGLATYHQKTHQGFWRYLVIRKSFFQNKFLINIVTSSIQADKFSTIDFTKFWIDKFGNKIAGILWSQSDSWGDTTQGENKRTLLYGKDHIYEKINNLEFQVSADSFFQTNPKSAELLYKKVQEYADLQPKKWGMDLFCGTGTIAQIIAKGQPDSQVFGVELVENAIIDAKKNAIRNQVTNVEFFAADVRNFLKIHPEFTQKIQTVIIDPPRSGMSPKALSRAIDLQATNFIYVSCNPATMARDAVLLATNGYVLEKFTIVDQFPHTSCVECVGKFVKS